ncbi:MAG: pyrroline-5-carboxylate reductase [Steroidobacteraceae bacterium]
MTHPSVSLIGGGNMGRAIAAGLIKDGWPLERLRIIEKDAEQSARLQAELGIEVAAQLTRPSDVLILAVKPQDSHATVARLAARMSPGERPLLLSIAAGITTLQLRDWTGGHCDVVRAMPNRAATLAESATALFAESGTGGAQRDLAERCMAAIGATVWVANETDLDSVTALSGSGPAYFLLLAEAMIDTAVELGLPRDVAARLCRQTLRGTALLADADGDLAALRASVTSKGGTTAAALASFSAGHFDQIVAAAMHAAAARSRELAAAATTTR